MSTDTAFLVGILALFGPKCPDRLRLFLLTLAIVDDIGAITVMSIFYTDEVDMAALALAAAIVVGILVLRWLKVWQLAPYVVAGIALWFAVQASGVHATLAGVIVGLLVPARPRGPGDHRGGRRLRPQADRRRRPPSASTSPSSPPARRCPTNDRLQRLLHPWSAFVVVPAVRPGQRGHPARRWSPCRPPRSPAWPSASPSRSCSATRSASPAPPPWRCGSGSGELPGRVRWGHLLGGAVLAGIGFTISLFIAELAFDDPQQLDEREDRHPRRVAHRRRARLDPAAVARREAAPVLPAQRRPTTAAAAPVAGTRGLTVARSGRQAQVALPAGPWVPSSRQPSAVSRHPRPRSRSRSVSARAPEPGHPPGRPGTRRPSRRPPCR